VDCNGVFSVIFTLMQVGMSVCFTVVNLHDLVLGEIQPHQSLDGVKQSINIASNLYAIWLVCSDLIQPAGQQEEGLADWMWHHGINIILCFSTLACYGWHVAFYIMFDRPGDALEMATKLLAALALMYCMDLQRSKSEHDQTNLHLHRMFMALYLVNWVMEQILAPVIFPSLVVELANLMDPALRVWLFSSGIPMAFMLACRKMHEMLKLVLGTRYSTHSRLDRLHLTPELSVVLILVGGLGLSSVYWTHSFLPRRDIPQTLQLIIIVITCIVCICWLVSTPSRTRVRDHDFVYHFLLWFGSLAYCILNLVYEPTFDNGSSSVLVIALGVTLVKDYWDNPWRWWLAAVSMLWTSMMWTEEVGHIDRLIRVFNLAANEDDASLEWLQALFPLLPEFFLFVAGTLLRKPKPRHDVQTDYLTF